MPSPPRRVTGCLVASAAKSPNDVPTANSLLNHRTERRCVGVSPINPREPQQWDPSGAEWTLGQGQGRIL